MEVSGWCRSTEDDVIRRQIKRSRNCAALLKITGEGPKLSPAKFDTEEAKQERLMIGFDD